MKRLCKNWSKKYDAILPNHSNDSITHTNRHIRHVGARDVSNSIQTVRLVAHIASHLSKNIAHGLKFGGVDQIVLHNGHASDETQLYTP